MSAADARLNSDDEFARKRADIDARIDAFLKGADIWAERKELDDELAARANDFLAGLKKLQREADEARKAEKKPHQDAARAVDDAWKLRTGRIERIIGIVRPLLDRFLRAKAEKERLAREEAERRRREAEEAARAAEADAAAAASASQRIEAEERAEAARRESEIAAAEAAKRAEPTRIESATGLANRRGLKTVRKARIVSLPLALAHYKDHADVADAILRLANAELRHAPVIEGVKQIPKIPGIVFDETQELA